MPTICSSLNRFFIDSQSFPARKSIHQSGVSLRAQDTRMSRSSSAFSDRRFLRSHSRKARCLPAQWLAVEWPGREDVDSTIRLVATNDMMSILTLVKLEV